MTVSFEIKTHPKLTAFLDKADGQILTTQATNLPALPDGFYWHVHKRLFAGGDYPLQINLRKKVIGIFSRSMGYGIGGASDMPHEAKIILRDIYNLSKLPLESIVGNYPPKKWKN